tara:strand:+ start:152 stop:709 length:558 start_codon:yes stop_codon:yes gene_type:complete
MKQHRAVKFRRRLTNVIILPLLACLVGACSSVDRREPSVYWGDNKLEFEISGAIRDQKLIRDENVSVTVFNGTVLLTGQARDRLDIDVIFDIAKGHKDAQRVFNRLEISDALNAIDRETDSLITARVKTQIALAAPLIATRIKVVTEQANVYLMGLVTSEEAGVAVEAAGSVSGVVRIIKVFEYI